MADTSDLTTVSRADQATRILKTVRNGLSTATWICDELLGMAERAARR